VPPAGSLEADAAEGASIGTLFAPGAGAAIGAGVGLAVALAGCGWAFWRASRAQAVPGSTIPGNTLPLPAVEVEVEIAAVIAPGG
jgi:hypothetical protein